MTARAVVVNGVEIPETLLAREVQNHPGASADEARSAAGHALAIRALLLRRARDLGVAALPERDDDGREETPDEALIRALLDRELEIAAPDEAECRRVYEARPDRFRAPELYEAAHILVEIGGDDEEGARARAKVICEMVLTGASSFADAAADYSACPSAGVGGSLGQLRPGDLAPEIEAVLAGLKPGAIAPAPVRTRFGWHVVRLLRRIEGRPLPFEAVAERIRLHLESRAWTAAAARYVADLAAEARAVGVALSLSPEGEVRDGSATLGDLIADTGAVDRLEPWLAAVQPDLARRVALAAAGAGESLPDFVSAALAAFVAEADDERWTNLISAVRDTEDPALACLAYVLRSRLAPAPQTFTLIRRAAS
ncbi:MAG: peptidylprolyl isomerase [Pseudomonadota bacterium]